MAALCMSALLLKCKAADSEVACFIKLIPQLCWKHFARRPLKQQGS